MNEVVWIETAKLAPRNSDVVWVCLHPSGMSSLGRCVEINEWEDLRGRPINPPRYWAKIEHPTNTPDIPHTNPPDLPSPDVNDMLASISTRLARLERHAMNYKADRP